MKIVLTGATGFVGKQVLKAIPESSDIALISRTKHYDMHETLLVEIDSSSDYSAILQSANVVIHCAARAHVMNDSSSNPLEVYREVNTRGTVNLARQAAIAGVKRFIFISSIKVNGEQTKLGKPFTYKDLPQPTDDYGVSKGEAEQQLVSLAKETGMEVVIIRPTLVYGPGVKANFASLMNVVSKGMPLPFGCITDNCRSLVSVANLVDLIITCIDHPKAANQTFLVSDDNDLSTSEMISSMANAQGKKSWQLPVPLWLYKLAGKLLNKSDVVNRLTGSLQVDISHTKDTLGWKPPQSLEAGFREVAKEFTQRNRSTNYD